MKITLVYPPNRNIPSSPYGALPLLAGCLGEAGHEVSIVDANLEVFERLIQPDTLKRAQRYFDEGWSRLRHKPNLTRDELGQLQGLARLSVVPFERLYEGHRAGQILRDPELFYEPENVNWAYDTIANLLRAVYVLNPVYYPLEPGFPDPLFNYLETDFDNPISQIVEEVVLDQVLATEPDLVGVCVPFNEQTVEAFSFLKQLKQRAPNIKTILGGAIISAYHQNVCTDERFYKYSDFAMPGEADLSFPEFATKLEAGEDLTDIPNLYHRDAEGKIHTPPRKSLPNLNDIAAPDFSSVPVGRYFLPETIANYQTSRGCYYGKCTFCSFDIKQNFRFRKAEHVTKDIEKIQAQTGLKHFIFWDPLTPPRLMKAISRWNKERPADEQFYWGAETKFEKIFTDQKFTDLLSEGGARFLQFGFESGSQRMLDLMVKGNDLDRVHLMLGAMKKSDIAVSVQWFIGFPGETEEEALASYRYLDDHRDAVVLSSYMGTFTLSPEDDIYQSQGELYDVDIFQKDDGMFDYRYKDGSDHYDRDELNAAYLSRGDAETVNRMAFYLYLTNRPEKAREICNFERGGAFPTEWSEVDSQRPRLPESNFVRSFDFDVFADPTQVLPAEGGPLPAGSSHAVLVTNSQMIYPLSDSELELIQLADGSRTADEIVAAASEPDAQQKLFGFVRRGILVIPTRELATEPAPESQVA